MNEAKVLVAVRSSRRRHLGPAERERIVALWSESGLSAEEVARRTGVSRASLGRWKRQLTVMAQPGVMRTPALVAVPRPIGGVDSVAEVMTRGGAVRFFAAATPAWAAQLIRELSRC